MKRRELAWLAVGLMLFAASVAAFAAFIVLSVLHHEPPEWIGTPAGAAFVFGLACVIRAFVPMDRE